MTTFFNHLKKYCAVYIALGIAALVMWTMLLPGYILSLDLVFTPHYTLSLSTDGFLNSLPLSIVLKFLYFLMPGWLVEKLALVSMFFLMSYLSFSYLPVPKRFAVRLFASLLYTANTFVYARMLAGQWTHLYAYALLPWWLHLLLAFLDRPTFKKSLWLAGSLLLMGIFSLHILIMALLVTGCFIVIKEVSLAIAEKKLPLRRLLMTDLAGLLAFFMVSLYWIIPSMLRSKPLEQAFTPEHWNAFAASGHGTVPVILNLLTLGGFWAEGQPWAQYFIWPQQHLVFWLAWSAVILLAVIGLLILCGKDKTPHINTQAKNTQNLSRYTTLGLLMVAIASFIFSTGTAPTLFHNLNLWLYQHIFFWTGFRDSQKFIAFVALPLVIFAATGFDWLIIKMEQWQKNKKGIFIWSQTLADYFIPLLFIIPLFFGIYVWGGFARQLQPVWYPASWYEAQKIITQHDETSDQPTKILVLPWQGYFSLSFNRNLITANPAKIFFSTANLVLVDSQNFRLDGVYDQNTDPSYNTLDQLVRTSTASSSLAIATYLRQNGFTEVLFFQDIAEVDTFSYEFLNSSNFSIILDTPELRLYTVK